MWIIVARIDGPCRVIPPVLSVLVVERHALHGKGVDAALNVDAESGKIGFFVPKHHVIHFCVT